MAEPNYSLLTEKERQEGVPGLFSPEELALAREASRQFADQEMMSDVYNRVSQDVAPGGIFGLLPYIGQSRDGGARFKTTMFEAGTETTPAKGIFDKPATYLSSKYPTNEEGFAYSERGSGYPLSSQVLMNEGLEPLRPEEIHLQQYSPTSLNEIKEIYEYFERNPTELLEVLTGKEATLIHEFTHRAVDAPWYPEFIKWAEQNLNQEDVDAIKYPKLSKENDESLSYTIGRLAQNKDTEEDQPNKTRLSRINSAMRRFLTPERQEEYGVRLPVPSPPPQKQEEVSMLQSVLNRIFN